jgi:RNA polymerase sigma-70 factor, ECF subfamily
VNESLGRLRNRRTAREFAESSAVTLADDNGATFDPERLVAREELRLVIESLVERLPKPFQEVFRLRAFEHLSVEETAVRLSIPQATVRTRYHRAKRFLVEALGPEFGSVLHDGFPFAGERCHRLTDQVLKRFFGSTSVNKIISAAWLSVATGPCFSGAVGCLGSLAP